MLKKFISITLIICAHFVLSSCKFDKSDNLYNFAKPYVGIYKCESIMQGDKDISLDYEKYAIELTAKGEMVVKYYEKGHPVREEHKGKYKFENDKIVVEKMKENFFIYEKGEITAFSSFGGTPVIAKFKQE